MMELFQKRDGAVSVFLAIILIPMMIIASIMIDYGRIQLGSAVASSAGDLTLNTALSQYDNVLKDMYGLFATSQSNEELLDNLEEYYTASIVAQGISKSAADDYVGQIMDILKGVSDGSSVDLMNMSVTDFNVNEPSQGSLVNPSLLRGQIVEFMKYRAPINGGMALLESLKSFSNLDKQMKLVEDKQAYYEEHASVLEHCEKAWGYMEVYLSHCEGASYFQNTKKTLDGYAAKYKDFNNKIIKDYYNSETAFHNVNYCSYAETDSVKDWSLCFNGSDIQKAQTYHNQKAQNASYEVPDSDIESLFQICSIALKADFTNKYNVTGTYPIQVIVQFNTDCENNQGYGKQVSNLFTAYYNLKDMYDELTDSQKELLIDNTGLKITDDTSSSVTVQQKFEEYTSQFQQIMTTYQAFTDMTAQNYNQYHQSFDENKVAVNTGISGISTEICAIQTNLTQAKEALDKCKAELEIVMNAVNPGNADSTLQKALSNWTAAANQSGIANDSLAQQDKAEIEQMKEYIKYDDVKGLVDRVGAASAEIQKELDEVGKYKYCKTFLGDIKNISKAKSVIKTAVNPKIPFKEADLTSLSEQTFQKQYQSGKFVSSWSDQSKSPVFSDSQPRFYTYLYKSYHRDKTSYESDINKVDSKETSDAKKEAEKQESTVKDVGEKDKDDAKKGNETKSKDVLNYFSEKKLTAPSNSQLYQDIINGKFDMPSISGEEIDNNQSSTGLTGLFSGIADKLKSASVDIRDYIYIEEYIMNMFSYNTYEKEIKAQLESSEKYEDKAVSLTKTPINSANNYSYLKEVEYIIYGGDNGTTKAYATIYGIRVAMNCIYAFTDSEIRNGAYSIAASVFGAPPLTPLIPVAQVGIIFAVALAESGIDLMYIKEGEAVPLFKDKNTWSLNFENLWKVLKGEAAALAKDVTGKVADKTKGRVNDWLDMTEEELKNKVNGGGQELNDLAEQLQNNVNEEVDRYVGVVTNELTTLCTKANDMILYGRDSKGNKIDDSNKTSLRVNYIKENLSSWWENQKKAMDSSHLGYQIEEAAVQYLLTKADNEIAELLNTMDTYGQKGINDAGDIVKEKIDNITGLMRKEVNNTCTKLNEYISGVKTKLKQTAGEGIDKFHDELNNGIDRLFGVEDTSKSLDIGKTQTSGVASMFKFRYSDYLGVFLMVSLLGNYEGVMGRLSDVIETNMTKVTGESFSIAKAYVYIKLNATIEVKPLLMTLPFMSEITQANTSGKDFYTITYNGVGGY